MHANSQKPTPPNHQRLLSNLNLSSPIDVLINSNDTINCDPPIATLIPLQNGNIFVAWRSTSDIIGQIITHNGIPFGSFFTVSDNALNNVNPSASVLSNGDFVVVYRSASTLYFRLFSQDGAKIGSSVPVTNTARATKICVLGLSNGNFVIIWPDDSTFSVQAQIFNNNGTIVSSSFSVNTISQLGMQEMQDPSASILDISRFVVTYRTKYSIYSQILMNDGSKVGNEFQINAADSSPNTGPTVQSFSDGRFIVVWYFNEMRLGQIFEANGSKVNSNFTLSARSKFFMAPAIVDLGNEFFAFSDDGTVKIFSESGESVGNDFWLSTFPANIYINTPDPNAFGNNQKIPMILSNDSMLVHLYFAQSALYAKFIQIKPNFYYKNFQKQGIEFVINTFQSDDQLSPSSCLLSNGKIAVVWQSYGPDSSSFGVFGQILDKNGGRIGSEFQVNAYVTGSQSHPAIAADSVDGFMVVWEDEIQYGIRAIYAQRFSNNGSFQGSEFKINSDMNGYSEDAYNPDVVQLLNRNWVFSYHTCRIYYEAYVKIFTNDGIEITQDILVNNSGNGELMNNLNATLLAFSDGSFNLFYNLYANPSGLENLDLYLQRFLGNGSKMNDPVLVQSRSLTQQRNPKGTLLSNGNFVLVWESGTRNDHDISAQCFFANNSKKGDEIKVNTFTKFDQTNPHVAALSDGKFLVVWTSYYLPGTEWYPYSDLDDTHIIAQVFSEDGGKIGREFRINYYSAKTVFPANIQIPKATRDHARILTLSNDQFMVIWESYGPDSSGFGIVGQIGSFSSPIGVGPYASLSVQLSKLQPFGFTISQDAFYESNGKTLTYECTNEIPWLTFDANTRNFSGIPPVDSLDNYLIEIIASNDQGAFASTTFKLIVLNIPPKVVGSFTNISAFVFQTIRIAIYPNDVFQDPKGQNLTFTVPFVPSWLSFNNLKNSFGGTPLAGSQGNYTIIVIASDNYGSSVSSNFTITVINRPPKTIGLIPNQTFLGGHNFSFPVPINTVFNDLDKDDLVGTVFLLNNETLPLWLSFNVTTFNFMGIPPSQDNSLYTINVSASDNKGGTTSALFYLSITPNHPPNIITPIPDKKDLSLNVSFIYTFPESTFFDVDGDTLNFTAKQSNSDYLPKWVSFNPQTRLFYGTPIVGSAKTSSIRVTADDECGGFASTDFILSRPNIPPKAGTLENITINGVGSFFAFEFSENVFYDDDGDALTLTSTFANGTNLPNWLLFDSKTRTFSASPRSGFQGRYYLKVRADDSNGGIIELPFLLTLLNMPPTANAHLSFELPINKYFTYSFDSQEFQDPDGDLLILTAVLTDGTRIPDWLRFFPENRTISGTPRTGTQGQLIVRITAADGFGGNASSNIDFTIPNKFPQANQIPNQICPYIGDPCNFTLPNNAFEDSDGDKLTLMASIDGSGGLPSWLSFNSDPGKFSGIPLKGCQGIYVLKVSAFDGHGGTASLVFTIAIPNRPPVINHHLIDQWTNHVGEEFIFDLDELAFEDPDNDTLTYGILVDGTDMPSWMSFNSSTKTFSGMPIRGSEGDHIIKISVHDRFGGIEQQNFTLVVPNRQIAVNQIASKTVYVGFTFSFLVPSYSFIDLDGYQLIFEAELANGTKLPQWIDFRNGLFSGTPTAPGELLIRVIAQNTKGTSASSTFKITIRIFETSATIPKVVGTIKNLNVTIGQPVNLTFPEEIFSNPSEKPLSYQAYQMTLYNTEEPLPQWLRFSERSFTGTPQNGTHVTEMTIKVRASNMYNESAEILLKVNFENRVPKLLYSMKNLTLIINQVYFISLPFDDEDGDSLSMTLKSKITFLELSSESKRITALPKTGDQGSYEVQVAAFDGFGGNSTTIFTIIVDYSDYDKWMQFVSYLIPILSSVGTAFGIYLKKGLIWNLFFFWVRPKTVVWNIKKAKIKILTQDMPGWFGRVNFAMKLKEKPVSGFCEKLKHCLKKITCRIPTKYGLFDNDIRTTALQYNINIIKPVVVVFSKGWLSKIINSWDFMDFLIRGSHSLIKVEIDKSDFSLEIPQSSKVHIQKLLNKGDQVKFLVIDYAGRALERVVCKHEDVKETQIPLTEKWIEIPFEKDMTPNKPSKGKMIKGGKRKTEEIIGDSTILSSKLEKNNTNN